MAPQESRRTNAPKRKGEAKKYRSISYNKNTGKWCAWIKDPTAVNTQKRQYVGQYDSETLAARAQDRAALKWKTDAVNLNFKESDYKEDEELREKLTHDQFRKLLVVESHSVSYNTEPSPCWAKFLAEEQAKANHPSDRPNVFLATFAEVLEYVMKEQETPHTTRLSIENHPVDNSSQDSHEDPIHIGTRSEDLNAPEPEEAMPGSLHTSEQSPHMPDRFAWKTRLLEYFTWAANSFKKASDVLAADPIGNIGTVSKNLDSGETDGTPAIVEGKEELRREPKLLPLFPIPSQDNAEGEQELGGEPTVQNSNKRKRLDTNVNRVPDVGLNGPPHEIDGNWKVDSDLKVRDSWGLFLSLGNKLKQ